MDVLFFRGLRGARGGEFDRFSSYSSEVELARAEGRDGVDQVHAFTFRNPETAAVPILRGGATTD